MLFGIELCRWFTVLCVINGIFLLILFAKSIGQWEEKMTTRGRLFRPDEEAELPMGDV